MSVWGPDGLVSRPGEGIRIEMGEHGMEVLARSTQTDGQFGVFDFRHGPIEANPPRRATRRCSSSWTQPDRR